MVSSCLWLLCLVRVVRQVGGGGGRLRRSGSKRRGGAYLNSDITVNAGYLRDIQYDKRIQNTEEQSVSYEGLKQQIAGAFGWFEKNDIESCNVQSGHPKTSVPISDASGLAVPQPLIDAHKEWQLANKNFCDAREALRKKQAIHDQLLLGNRLNIAVTLKKKEIHSDASVVLKTIMHQQQTGNPWGERGQSKHVHRYELQFSDRTTLIFETTNAPGSDSHNPQFTPLSNQTLYNMTQTHIEAIRTYASDQTKDHHKIATDILTYIQRCSSGRRGGGV